MKVLTDGPRRARAQLILAHGAGAPMDSDFMETIARGVANAGIRVVRFEFPYMAARREGRRPPPDRMPVLCEAFLDVIAKHRHDRLVIGGKSMGGRVAATIAAQPIAAQPIAARPIAVRPIAARPIAVRLSAAGLSAAGLNAAGLSAARLSAGWPSPGWPIAARSIAVQPIAAQPIAALPIAAGLSAAGLSAGRPIAAGLSAGRPIAAGLSAGRPIAAGLSAGRPIAAGLSAGRPIVARLSAAGLSAAGLSAAQPIAARPIAVRGVICLGYPFHAAGQPAKLRLEPLLEAKLPVHIVQGTRDPFGTRREVAGFELPGRIGLTWLEDGDHSFLPRKASGHTEDEHLASAVGAIIRFVDKGV